MRQELLSLVYMNKAIHVASRAYTGICSPHTSHEIASFGKEIDSIALTESLLKQGQPLLPFSAHIISSVSMRFAKIMQPPTRLPCEFCQAGVYDYDRWHKNRCISQRHHLHVTLRKSLLVFPVPPLEPRQDQTRIRIDYHICIVLHGMGQRADKRQAWCCRTTDQWIWCLMQVRSYRAKLLLSLDSRVAWEQTN